MTESKTIKVETIVQHHNAIASLGDMDMLEGAVAFSLGNYGSYCVKIAKMLKKEEQRLLLKYKDELRSNHTTSERKNKITEIINIRLDSINNTQETIDVPKFKLSDFIAKTDKKSTIIYEGSKDGKSESRTEIKEFKEGQQLVPVSFFVRMAECIEDDKNSNKAKIQEKSKLESFLEQVAPDEKDNEVLPQIAEINNKSNKKQVPSFEEHE